MTQYIMRRFAEGMHGEGEKLFPKLINSQVVSTSTLAEHIETGTSFTTSDVRGLITAFVDEIKAALSAGHSVKIDGLGTFSPVLGLVEKSQRGAWKDTAGRTTTAHNVHLKRVAFRPDTRLKSDLEQHMKLEKADDSAIDGVKPVSSTLDERLAKAKAYLAEKSFMRVANYAALTHLSYSTAAKELRTLAADPASGIAAQGVRAGRIYVLSEE